MLSPRASWRRSACRWSASIRGGSVSDRHRGRRHVERRRRDPGRQVLQPRSACCSTARCRAAASAVFDAWRSTSGGQQGRRRPHDRVRGRASTASSSTPARRRHDRRHADRLDRLRAVRQRADPASRRAGIALVPICPHTLSNRPIAVSSDRASRSAPDLCRRRARAFRRPAHFDLRSGDRVVSPRSARTRSPCCIRRGYSYSRCCARSCTGANAAAATCISMTMLRIVSHPRFRHRRIARTRIRGRLHRAHRRDRRRQVDPGRCAGAGAGRARRCAAGAQRLRARRDRGRVRRSSGLPQLQRWLDEQRA